MRTKWGIEFAPLNIPMHRRLETLAIAFCFTFFTIGGILVYIFLAWSILFSPFFRPLSLLYILWWYYDFNSAVNGNRYSPSARNWRWHKLICNYYPVKIVKTAEFQPNTNYLFIGFPHGILSGAFFSGLGANGCGFDDTFSGGKIFFASNGYLTTAPIIRELSLPIGLISASEKTILSVVGEQRNSMLLLPGGASEALCCKRGHYTTLIGRRKGFIRLALKMGVSLIPTIAFGEPEVFDTYTVRDGSLLQKLLTTLQNVAGASFPLFRGRGIFQYSYGIMPRRHPVHIVMGKPMEMPKLENPSQEQIADYHRLFCHELKSLFDREKPKYVNNYQNVELEFAQKAFG